jgi:hypothetical protein
MVRRRSVQRGRWAPIVVPVILLLLGCGRSGRTDGTNEPSSSGRGGTAGTGRGGTGGTEPGGGTAGDAGDFGGDQGGAGASVGGAGGVPGSSSVALEGAPIYTRVQRLTNTQWRNAVTDILRLDAPGTLGDGFRTPASGTTEFTNNEKLLYVDEQGVQDFELGSEAAAALATGSADALSRLDAGDNAAEFVSTLGRRAFRRPLSEAEQTKYEDVFALGEELYGAGFERGAALVIRAMLVSPHFLYRTELGPAGDPLTGYEVASKLSFWLLDTTPSDALLDSAAAGDLDSAEGVESVARQLLEQPGAADVMRDFHHQAFRLSRLESVTKPLSADYDASVAAEALAASTLFFDRVFETGGGLRQILTSPDAFMGPKLAPLYGVADPPGVIEERALDASRVGYFMQVPFLLLFGAGDQPATIARGIAINWEMLCNRLPVPQDLPPLPPPPVPGTTNREQIEELTSDCGDCHRTLINPLGFAFDAFDGLGRERALDNGLPLDTSGSYPFSDGAREFSGAKELVQIMADTAQAHTCYAKKVTGYALQRDLVEADRPLLGTLSEVSRQEDSLTELVISLVRNPAFRLRAEGP